MVGMKFYMDCDDFQDNNNYLKGQDPTYGFYLRLCPQGLVWYVSDTGIYARGYNKLDWSAVWMIDEDETQET